MSRAGKKYIDSTRKFDRDRLYTPAEAFEAAHDGPDRDAVHAAEPPEHAAMEQLPLDELLHLAGVAVGEGPALRHGYAAVVRAASTTAGSMRMPGPIVDDVAIDLM